MKESHRAAVGPADKYDILGALQFKVLTDLGLREHHRLLDIGCGSLRGGRLFIVYLKPGKYFGIEPNQELVETGIKEELGQSVIDLKGPQFAYNTEFEPPGDDRFDFVLAQSIFSHAAPYQVEDCLNMAGRRLTDDGLFVATFFPGNVPQRKQWSRPIVRYSLPWLTRKAADYGLVLGELDYGHPSGQTWVKIVKG